MICAFFCSTRKRTTPSIQRPLRPTTLRCLTPHLLCSSLLPDIRRPLLFLTSLPRCSGGLSRVMKGAFFICGAADRSGRGKRCCCCCCCGICGLFLDLPCTLKRGASRENFSTKWMHSQKKLFFEMGAFKEFTSK